ncbi:MAG: hypothetical protein KBC15_03910 [Candidatus Levybacteria bacterium]|nr:hypothetical protein [Candidatus Levybacteria bacterium]
MMEQYIPQQDRAFQAPRFVDGPPRTPEPVINKEVVKKEIVQYEGDFDRQKARELLQLQDSGFEDYLSAEQGFNEFITLQLLTMLGERFNRGKSEFMYREVNGKLVGDYSNEPLEDVFERGRAYREIHGNPSERAREQAEVDGFRRTQQMMLDAKAGTKVISVSPPNGETYQHNFFDIFEKKESGEVEAVRYSSALSVEETMEKLFEISTENSFPIEFPEDWSDVGLLSHPILLDTSLSVDQIYRKLHRDHEIMSDDEFDEVTRSVKAIITSYTAVLLSEPENINKHNLHLNAILNAADLAKERIREKKNAVVILYDDYDIDVLGHAPVRAVNAGCGYSGGFNVMAGESALRPFGVAGFARAEDDPSLCKCGGQSPHFHCPGEKTVKPKSNEEGHKKKEPCNFVITVGKNITSCPDCGEGKRC